MKKFKLFLCIFCIFFCGCEHKISDSSQEAQTAFPQKTIDALFDEDQLLSIANEMYPSMYKEWFSFVSANRYYDDQKFQDQFTYKIERDDIQSIEDIKKDYYAHFSKRYDFPLDLDKYKKVYQEKEDGLYAKFSWNNVSSSIYYPGKINEIGDDYVVYEIYYEDEQTNIYDTNQSFSLVYSQEKWIYGTFFNEKEKDVKLECKYPVGKYVSLEDSNSYIFVGSNQAVSEIPKDRALNIKSVKRHFLDGKNASYWGECQNGSWVCLSDEKGTYFEVRK